MIRVLVADDHALVRKGVSDVLANADDIECVGAAADGAEAIELVRTQRPDVVLMDLSMPVMDGIEATRRIAEMSPETQVVVLTSFSDRDRIVAALDAGAIGYLLKDAEPADVLAGIHAAARGDSPLSPKAARVLLRERARSRPADQLSEREREVLALVAQGLANKAIAIRLGISEKTVKAHLTSIFRQIDVYDRVQAALWARDHGLGAQRSRASSGPADARY